MFGNSELPVGLYQINTTQEHVQINFFSTVDKLYRKKYSYTRGVKNNDCLSSGKKSRRGNIDYFYINSFKHIIVQWGDVNDIFTHAPVQIWLDLELNLKFKLQNQVEPKKNYNFYRASPLHQSST